MRRRRTSLSIPAALRLEKELGLEEFRAQQESGDLWVCSLTLNHAIPNAKGRS